MAKSIQSLTFDFTDDDWLVLEKLNEVGAATSTDLAVRLRRMPEIVTPRLSGFLEKGLVEARRIDPGHDGEVFYVSDQGRKILGMVHRV